MRIRNRAPNVSAEELATIPIRDWAMREALLRRSWRLCGGGARLDAYISPWLRSGRTLGELLARLDRDAQAMKELPPPYGYAPPTATPSEIR